MAKKLFVDLDICDKCEECVIECSYFHHLENCGITSLRELITYSLVCRKCEEASCVKSCPQDALEKKDGDILRRFNMLCISCKSCILACPFGTIYPEYVPYIIPKCDYCIDRSETSNPLCVDTCPYKALDFREVEEKPEEGIYLLGDNLAVHSRIKWEKIEL